MKMLKHSLIILLLSLGLVSPVLPGAKEVKHSTIKLVKTSEKADGFYIKIEFDKIDLPEHARLTNIQLVLDQKLEKVGQDDSTLSPRGLVNTNNRPVVFVAHCFQAKESPELGNWMKSDSTNALNSMPGVLIPQTVIDSERNRGVRGNKAMGFDVTRAVRGMGTLANDNLIFLLRPQTEEATSTSFAKVKIETGSLSARLVLVYAEPPVSPRKPE